jgi:hypothetical protein
MTATPMMTPPEVARRWRVSPDKVVGFIRSGMLRAADLASATSSRPRYRIDMADVLAFEASRAAKPLPKPIRRRKPRNGSVVEFF